MMALVATIAGGIATAVSIACLALITLKPRNEPLSNRADRAGGDFKSVHAGGNGR